MSFSLLKRATFDFLDLWNGQRNRRDFEFSHSLDPELPFGFLQ
jgi:hypothetical protein